MNVLTLLLSVIIAGQPKLTHTCVVFSSFSENSHLLARWMVRVVHFCSIAIATLNVGVPTENWKLFPTSEG